MKHLSNTSDIEADLATAREIIRRLCVLHGCTPALVVEWCERDSIRANNAERELATARKALKSQIEWWMQVPSGVDFDADIENESPEDSTAHIAGLAIREARAVIDAEK